MKLEAVLARVLELGTWIASATIALGLVARDDRVVIAGIAGLLALPPLRVLIMLAAFARARDVRAASVALLVLGVLALGLALG